MKFGIILWNGEDSIPNPFCLVHNSLKFSEVFGTTSGLNSTLMAPKGSPFALIDIVHMLLSEIEMEAYKLAINTLSIWR